MGTCGRRRRKKRKKKRVLEINNEMGKIINGKKKKKAKLKKCRMSGQPWAQHLISSAWPGLIKAKSSAHGPAKLL